MRGGDVIPACMQPAQSGSSPHARERRTFSGGQPTALGFIPACAGETFAPQLGHALVNMVKSAFSWLPSWSGPTNEKAPEYPFKDQPKAAESQGGWWGSSDDEKPPPNPFAPSPYVLPGGAGRPVTVNTSVQVDGWEIARAVNKVNARSASGPETGGTGYNLRGSMPIPVGAS
jgi:hypothetical protein